MTYTQGEDASLHAQGRLDHIRLQSLQDRVKRPERSVYEKLAQASPEGGHSKRLLMQIGLACTSVDVFSSTCSIGSMNTPSVPPSTYPTQPYLNNSIISVVFNHAILYNFTRFKFLLECAF